MYNNGVNTIYHAMSRGVDKRKIFMDSTDRLRFITNLSVFNDSRCVSNLRNSGIATNRHATYHPETRNQLVAIYAFCLMPNHYHLLLGPTGEETNSMSRFFQKLNNGYAQYFNKKHGRKGTLFETRFKRIEIKNESHFLHLPYYIHCNPLDLFDKGWRNRSIKNFNASWNFLERYQWSSHQAYLGKSTFPHVLQREFLSESFGGASGYKTAIMHWLKNIEMPSTEETIE